MKNTDLPIKLIILVFLFSIVSNGLTAQKINLDSLNFKQLNQYMIKADKMRNAGMIITVSGIGIGVTGSII
ncbi:MAG: hypothetical protein IQL11_00325 [Bacteroidales bacterium]|nr:hypothetical protein [Bacteroidales bacterium]